MQRLNQDDIVRVLVPYFLRQLMKSERERIGILQKDASIEAGWPSAVWGAVERGARSVDTELWIQAADVLGLTPNDVVKHLNRFIEENPSIWVEIPESGELTICTRPVTSPRAIRSGHLANVDLNPIRPVIYHELSNYAENASDIISAAVSNNFYTARNNVFLPSQIPAQSTPEMERRMYVANIVNEMSPEKFGLLERVIDKFNRYSPRQLAIAYQHFSLSLKNK